MLAALPALLLSLPIWLRPLWLGLVVLSYWLERRRHLKWRPVSLSYNRGEWRLTDSTGKVWRHLHDWYASRWLCVLVFSRPRRVLLLPADALSAEQHRQLRVLLRTEDPRIGRKSQQPLKPV